MISSRIIVAIFALITVVYMKISYAQQIVEVTRPEQRGAGLRLLTADCAVKGVMEKISAAVSFLKRDQENQYSDVSWTGQCVDGKRDGEGVLRYRLVISPLSTGTGSISTRAGTMVKGEFVGWVNVVTQSESAGAGSGRSYWYMAKGDEAAQFVKLADGRFQQVATGTNTPVQSREPVPEQEMIERSRQLVAQARAGATAGNASKSAAGEAEPVRTSAVLRSLSDLLPGGKVVYARERRVADIKSKTLGILISTSSEQQLKQYNQYLDQLKRATLKVSEDAVGLGYATRKQRMQYLDKLSADKLMVAAAEVFGGMFKSALVVQDLAEFREKRLDYAVVLDFYLPGGGASASSRVEGVYLNNQFEVLTIAEGFEFRLTGVGPGSIASEPQWLRDQIAQNLDNYDSTGALGKGAIRNYHSYLEGRLSDRPSSK